MYEAEHSLRYERQRLIREYQEKYSCRFIVMTGNFFLDRVTPLEETLYDADPKEDLHLLLQTFGGDPETALRLIRQVQSRCKELTVLIPDQAKSAGTLFVLGADHICMGPTSDLGPIDPQLWFPAKNDFASAKSIIAAVEDAEKRVQKNPQTYPIHVSLLADITALMVQQSRDAIDRTSDQLKKALACVSQRTSKQVSELAQKLQAPLIDDPPSHRAVISASDAVDLGLPVREMSSTDPQWQAIWRLWAKYAVLDAFMINEGQSASRIIRRPAPSQ